MRKKPILITVSTLLLLMIVVVVAIRINRPQKMIHYHAGFQIYVDGKIQEYSGDQYMHSDVCNVASNTSDPDSRIHLHNHFGDVAHIHASGVTWGELFQYLHIRNTQDPVLAYINGQPVTAIDQIEIKPYDSLILDIGSDNNFQAQAPYAVSRSHILEVEQTKEACGK